MKNIVSFETAKKLEIAGFERPMPKIGQFWYIANGELRLVAGSRDGEFIVNGSFDGRWRELVFDVTFENWIYAPTATDLLEQLPDCKMWNYKGFWYFENQKSLFITNVFVNENAAEAVAEAFLSQTK